MKSQNKNKIKRKHILLRNEIEMLQIILEDRAFPTEEYRFRLIKRLEELKGLWYKVKLKKHNSTKK